MATIRELIVQLRQRGGKAVSDALVKVRENSDATRKAFGALTDAVVADSARMATALREVRGLRLGGLGGGGGLGGSGGGGGGGRRPGRNQRVTGHEAGDALSRGSAVGRAARNALGAGAGGADRARADVDDLSQAIDRNRRELQRLRAEAIRTGDADGKLAAQTRGLTVATSRLTLDLRKARGEVAAFDKAARAARGGAGLMSRGVSAISVAAGNLLSGGISRAFHGISDAIVDSGKKAVDFESSMAQVAKVVDGLKTPTGETTEEFGKMADGLKKLSTEVGLEGGAGAFAKLASAIGETGLEKSTEGILRFSEDAAKTAVAFDVTAEEAGEGLAKLRAGLGLTQDEVVSLAGTFNVLSNEGASSAKDLLDAGLRVSAVGKAFGLTGQEVAAFNSVMLSAGETPERAATATKNLVLALGAGESATKSQRAAFKALGLEADDVAKRFSESMESRKAVTVEVLSKLKGLTETQGAEKTGAITKFLFGKDSLGGIAAITTNIDGYVKALDLATDTTRAASSVQDEYNVRSKTTANQLQLLKNNVDNAKIALGDALIPVLADLAPMLVEMAQGVAAWLKENRELVTQKVKDFVFGIIEAGRELAPVVSGVVDVVGMFISGLSTLTDTIGGTSTAILALGVAAAGLTGPFGLAAAAGVAAGVAIFEAFNKAEQGMLDLHKTAEAIRQKEHAAEMAAGKAEIAAGEKEFDRHEAANQKRAQLEARQAAALRAKGLSEIEISRKVATLTLAAQGSGSLLGGGTEDERLAAWERRLGSTEAPAGGGAGESLGEQARKKGRGRKRRKHGTKMDANLARLNPELAGVLVQGGDEDSGGDLKVHDDPLSRAAYKRSAGIGGGIGNGGTSGPNITNNGPFTWNIEIDARGNESAEAGVYAAGEAFARKGERFVLTGLSKVLATVNAGGRLMPP